MCFIIAALIPGVAIPLIYSQFRPFPIELALASVVAGAIFLIAGYANYRQATSVYLVTSPEGIEFHTHGNMRDALWSEITSIGPVPSYNGYYVEGLIIRSKVAPSGLPSAHQEQGWFHWSVPLQPFGWYWKATGLGEEIRRYAPHLLNIQQEQPSRTDMQEHQ
ncbi:MAG TPA: hypothetical protein VFH60_04710 [Chloroflexia bacterium]|nr:hypothetical protein [Chloroflexia bacterium]